MPPSPRSHFRPFFITTKRKPRLIRPRHWQPPISFLSLGTHLFWRFHVNGAIYPAAFCVWLPPLSMMFSRCPCCSVCLCGLGSSPWPNAPQLPRAFLLSQLLDLVFCLCVAQFCVHGPAWAPPPTCWPRKRFCEKNGRNWGTYLISFPSLRDHSSAFLIVQCLNMLDLITSVLPLPRPPSTPGFSPLKKNKKAYLLGWC